MKALSQSEIMELAPAVYTNQPHPKVSDKYSFLPTHRIVSDMEKLGWSVSQVKMAKTNNPNQKLYGKHMVQFFHPDLVINDENGKAEAYPQILVQNNHRAYGRLKIEVGVFRLVCENGLVIKEEGKDFGSYSLRHMGYSFEELKELVNKVVEDLPHVVNKINKFTERVMTKEEQREFAIKALQARFGEERVVDENEISSILVSRRNQDNGDDLYRVFNRIQEGVVRGGFDIAGRTKSGRKKVRSITNIEKDIELNKKIWAIASEFVEA